MSLNNRQLSRAFTYYERNHFMVEVISTILVTPLSDYFIIIKQEIIKIKINEK